MTFSIVARCGASDMFGVAISSSSPAVAARCAYARAGVGAITTQNVTDPRLGPVGLEFLAGDATASQALERIVASAGAHAAWRQVAIVDRAGRTAIHSGTHALGINAHCEGGCEGDGAVAAGNLLAHVDVPAAMIAAFESGAHLELGDRLLGALDAAMALGGEAGPVHSAGLLVVDRQSWPLVDLRVDWSEHPVADLHGAYEAYKPQMNDYVLRALNPAGAPSFGVPGDL